jgi:hypothetical protein
MGIVFLLVGLGLFCVLLWNFAVYAVPAFVGFAVGFWALDHGAGIGCVLVGLVAGVATCIAGRFALTSPNAVIRWLVIAIFTLPAAYAGYSMVLELSAMGVPSTIWRHVFAGFGAVAVGVTTFARLTAPFDERTR